VGALNAKVLNKIDHNQRRSCAWGRRSLVLILITLFRNCKWLNAPLVIFPVFREGLNVIIHRPINTNVGPYTNPHLKCYGFKKPNKVQDFLRLLRYIGQGLHSPTQVPGNHYITEHLLNLTISAHDANKTNFQDRASLVLHVLEFLAHYITFLAHYITNNIPLIEPKAREIYNTDRLYEPVLPV
jgi:hypothetical protein